MKAATHDDEWADAVLAGWTEAAVRFDARAVGGAAVAGARGAPAAANRWVGWPRSSSR